MRAWLSFPLGPVRIAVHRRGLGVSTGVGGRRRAGVYVPYRRRKPSHRVSSR